MDDSTPKVTTKKIDTPLFWGLICIFPRFDKDAWWRAKHVGESSLAPRVVISCYLAIVVSVVSEKSISYAEIWPRKQHPKSGWPGCRPGKKAWNITKGFKKPENFERPSPPPRPSKLLQKARQYPRWGRYGGQASSIVA